MEVTPGHKRTEAGIVPEEWHTPTLGTLTLMMTNGFVGTATTHYAENDNGALYIQGYNVKENSFDFHGIKYVTDSFHKAHMKSCLRSGDLLTVQTGDVGVTTIVPKSLEGSNCHALIISRFDQRKVSPAFISRYLNSGPGRSRLKLIETGTTMKHLNVGDMLQFVVPLPPTKAEQEAIAEALSEADALIESLEQLIAKKRMIKQGAMQELLTGRRRLPGFEGKWHVVTADEIGRFRGGSGFPTRFQGGTSGEYPLFKVSDMNIPGNETYMERANNYISDELRRQLGAIAFPANSIVFAKVGAAVFLERKKILSQVSCLDNNMAAFVFDTDIADCRFLHYQLLNIKLSKLVSTTALPSLSGSVLAAIEFTLPPIAEQRTIVESLSEMDAEILLLDEKMSKLRCLKQGMMQELLTGRIRLV